MSQEKEKHQYHKAKEGLDAAVWGELTPYCIARQLLDDANEVADLIGKKRLKESDYGIPNKPQVR